MNVYFVTQVFQLPSSNLATMDQAGKFLSLFHDRPTAELAEVAPYISLISRERAESSLGGLAGAAGIAVLSGESIESVRSHLRKFLKVRLESGQRMHFRFYDPQILRNFLPTCTTAQLAQFYGSVQAFALRGQAESDWLVFRLINGELHTSAVQGVYQIMSIDAAPVGRSAA